MVETAAADALLAHLVKRHAGRVADLDARLACAGMGPAHPPTWDTLEAVPPRAKSDLAALQRQHANFGGLAPTPGLGQVPSAIYWSPGGLAEPHIEAAVSRLADLLLDAGFVAGDRVANGFSYHFTPAGLLVHEALVRLGATVLPIGPQQTAQAADFLVATAATGFIGTAPHLQAIMSAIDALPADHPRPPLRLALAGSEPFSDGARQKLTERHGIRCLDFYGVAEGGIVAVGCPTGAGLHLHPNVIAEVVDPGTGTRNQMLEGELLLTADSDELPLLRFATGDSVRLEHGPCACGRKTPRLHILGRVGESARVRGMLLHATQLRAFARATDLSACLATITRIEGRDHIELRYRAEQSAVNDTNVLAQTFRDRCRLRADAFLVDATLAQGEVALVDHRSSSETETSK